MLFDRFSPIIIKNPLESVKELNSQNEAVGQRILKMLHQRRLIRRHRSRAESI